MKERDLAKAFISSDNYNAGKVCGEDLKEKMPDGGKLVIVEDKADQNLSEGISGFEEKIKNGGFEVVKRVDGAQTDGMTKELNEILSSGTKVEVIMCADDQMAEAVRATVKESGKTIFSSIVSAVLRRQRQRFWLRKERWRELEHALRLLKEKLP